MKKYMNTNNTNNNNRPVKKLYYEIYCKSEMTYPSRFVPSLHPFFTDKKTAEDYAREHIVSTPWKVEPVDILDEEILRYKIYRKI